MDQPTDPPTDLLTDPRTGLPMDQSTDTLMAQLTDPPMNQLISRLINPLIDQLINPMKMTDQISVSSLDWLFLSPLYLVQLVVILFIPNSTRSPKLNQSISKPMLMSMRVLTNQAAQAKPEKRIQPKHRFSFYVPNI